MNKSYSELMKLKTFKERYNYLKLGGKVGDETFGYDRIFNQIFYGSGEWKEVRKDIIVRDAGRDLGVEGFDIGGTVIVHHINPITLDDIMNKNPKLFDPENLICVSSLTHKAIHYSNEDILITEPVVRSSNDMCPWKN